MQSKTKLLYHSNGKLESVETNPVFQGSVATTEFFLEMAEDMGKDTWLPTDAVFICFIRADSQPSGPLKMILNEDGKSWKYTSNGWIEDVELGDDEGTFRVSFIMRRYSPLDGKTLIKTRTTEEIDLTIYPSENYTPQDIPLDVTETLFAEFVKLENEVGKLTKFSTGNITASRVAYTSNPTVTANIRTDETTGGYKLDMDFEIPEGPQGVSVIGANIIEMKEN